MSVHRGHPLRRARGRPHLPVTRTRGAPAPEPSLDHAPDHAPDPSPDHGDLDIPASVRSQLEAYLDRMLVENQKVNLTAIRDRADALALHVVDSLQVWSVIARPPSLILDIGSGNGFPGVAAACLWPDARTILVERTQKKARAIRACLDDVGLTRVETLPIDAAQLAALHPELCGRVDLVLTRATADLAVINDAVAKLLTPTDATIVHWKAAAVSQAERTKADRSVERLHLTPRADYLYELPGRERRIRRLVAFVR